MSAVKHDQEKNRLELIPVEFIEATGRALTYGSRKYAAQNWRTGEGMDWGRVYGALQRHLNAFWKGEDIDGGEKGSGLHHLDCAAAELAFLITYVQTQTGRDTRWKTQDTNPPSQAKAAVSDYCDSTSTRAPESSSAGVGHFSSSSTRGVF